MRTPFGLRDPTGALWAADTILEDKGTYSIIKAYRTFRITDNAPAEEIAIDNWPYLVDQSGNVWFVQTKPTSLVNRLSIWRDGKFKQHLEIRGADTVYGLFSDRPDSVFAWTALGLHHFAIEKTNGNEMFVAKGEMRFRLSYALGEASFGSQWAYSKVAGLVLSSNYARHTNLVFVRLPAE